MRSAIRLCRFLLQLFAIAIIPGLCCVGRNSSATKNRASGVGTLAEFLVQDYDKSTRPNCEGSTVVLLDMYIESFGKIEEVNMEFSLSMYLRQYWEDRRLTGLVNETVVLEHEHISKLWTPAPYCSNAKKSDLMLRDEEIHSAVHVSPNGSIFYSRSASIVASCDMDLRLFPFDVQKCHLHCGSYGYTDAKVKYSWKENFVVVANKELAQFTVGEVTLSSETGVYVSGNYTVLTATFAFERHLGYYVIQMYVPCLFLVMLSWIVFWMDPGDGSSRLTVGITTILTIVFLLGYTNSTLPKVSYVKGMDWYIMAAFLFIFLSLVECIVVDKLQRTGAGRSRANSSLKTPNKFEGSRNHGLPRGLPLAPGVLLYRTKKPRKQANKADELAGELCLGAMEEGKDSEPGDNPSRSTWERGSNPPVCCLVGAARGDAALRVDSCCRVAFPVLFTLFNIAYWVSLTGWVTFGTANAA